MFDRNGFIITAGPGAWVLWESLDTMIAQVDALTGNVTATSNGQARIVAHSFTGVQDTVVVIVDAPPVDPRLLADAASDSHWQSSGIVAIEFRRKF
jgi:hypothetical protein